MMMRGWLLASYVSGHTPCKPVSPRVGNVKNTVEIRVRGCEIGQMTEMGVRRDKAALSSGCKPHPAIRSSRKQPEQAWRRRNV